MIVWVASKVGLRELFEYKLIVVLAVCVHRLQIELDEVVSMVLPVRDDEKTEGLLTSSSLSLFILCSELLLSHLLSQIGLLLLLKRLLFLLLSFGVESLLNLLLELYS